MLNFVQAQSFTLAGAGAILGDTTIVLSAFNGINGIPLTMADFGDEGFCTIEPNSGTQEEQIVFTGVTQNANGTATLTGVSSVAFITPYTQTSGLTKTHAGGVILVVSNTSGFYATFPNLSDDETITGLWTFVQYPEMQSVAIFPTLPTQLVPKAYADSLTFNGAPNASPTVQGLVQEATTSQVNAGTNIGSTGAVLFASPADLAASIYGLQLPSSAQKSGLASVATPSSTNTYTTGTDLQKNQPVYGADSVGTDAYAITPTPAVSAYTDGMTFYFKAGTANTGGATLQVGSGSAVAIVKQYNTALVTGDILQHQIVQVSYNSTNSNWQMVSPVGTAPLTTTASYTTGTTTKNAADTSATQTIAHGLGAIPKYVRLNCISDFGSGNPLPATALATYNGTTQASQSLYLTGNTGSQSDNTFTLNTSTTSGTTTGVVTFDATNISIVWTKTDSPTGVYQILWEAFGPAS